LPKLFGYTLKNSTNRYRVIYNTINKKQIIVDDIPKNVSNLSVAADIINVFPVYDLISSEK
jgi:hypothetical protein